MTGEIFESYMAFIASLFPYLVDEPGSRVIVKADMGPGRFNQMFLAQTSELGLKIFPGLPNGTEVCQELDQNFSAMKTKIYSNRDMLYHARCRILGIANAKVSFEDAGYLLFGGNVRITNHHTGETESIELPFSYITGLSRANLQSSRRKCGYWPATRASLFSDQVAVDLLLEEPSSGNTSADEDGLSEEDLVDPFQSLLKETRDLNHEVVERLVRKGYKLAVEAKRNLEEVNADDVQSAMELVYTEPHTRERQDQLQTVSRAGQFFKYTFGGDILNSSDFLIAMERKSMKKEYEKLKKRKQLVLSYHNDIVPAARLVFEKSYHKWTTQNFFHAIKYKQGIDVSCKEEKIVTSMKKPHLKKVYEEFYQGCKRSTLVKEGLKWGEEQEHRLNNCERGVIDDLRETAIFGKAIDANNEYVVARLGIISSSRRRSIILDTIEKCTAQEKLALIEEAVGLLDNNEQNMIVQKFISGDGDNHGHHSDTLNSAGTIFDDSLGGGVNDDNNDSDDDRSLSTIYNKDDEKRTEKHKNKKKKSKKKMQTARKTGRRKKGRRMDLLLDDSSIDSYNDSLSHSSDDSQFAAHNKQIQLLFAEESSEESSVELSDDLSDELSDELCEEFSTESSINNDDENSISRCDTLDDRFVDINNEDKRQENEEESQIESEFESKNIESETENEEETECKGDSSIDESSIKKCKTKENENNEENGDGENGDKEEGFDESNRSRDDDNEDMDGPAFASDKSNILVCLSSFKIKNDGVRMLESELNARGVAFNEKKKQIKPLKKLLKKYLNNVEIFEPISVEIRDAIERGDIETENE